VPSTFDRHDLFRTARRVVRQRRQVHDSGAARRRVPQPSGIEDVHAVGAVEAGDVVAESGQVAGHRITYVTAVPGDQDAHGSVRYRGENDDSSRTLCNRHARRSPA
jgi:hypothetical protein